MRASLSFTGIAAIALAGLLAGTWSDAAHAFRPSSAWITGRAMHKKIKRNIRTLKVEQEVTLFGDPNAPRGVTVEGQTMIMSPSGFRQSRQSTTGGKDVLFLYTKKRTWIRDEGGNDQIKRTRRDVLADYFSAGKPMSRWDAGERLQKSLKAMKVNVDRVSFQRFSGAVNYVVGAKPGEKDKPQVWFDKDSLLLTRIIRPESRASGKKVLVDIQLTGWGSPEAGNWFPKTVEIYEDGKLKERWVTVSADRNKNLGAELFEVRK